MEDLWPRSFLPFLQVVTHVFFFRQRLKVVHFLWVILNLFFLGCRCLIIIFLHGNLWIQFPKMTGYTKRWMGRSILSNMKSYRPAPWSDSYKLGTWASDLKRPDDLMFYGEITSLLTVERKHEDCRKNSIFRKRSHMFYQNLLWKSGVQNHDSCPSSRCLSGTLVGKIATWCLGCMEKLAVPCEKPWIF